MKAFLFTQFALFMLVPVQGQSISATYTSGHIPTNFNTYDNSCNGPSATLTITLAAGESYTVSNVDVGYAMMGFGSGWKSHQRSLIKLQNTNAEEGTEAVGVGDITGTQTYARSISIANGNYTGGTELVFQMKAHRTKEGNPGYNILINRMDNNTWTITVIISFGTNTNQGKAYIFKRNNTNCLEQAALTSSDDAASDYFGKAVSISDTNAMVEQVENLEEIITTMVKFIFFIEREILVEQVGLVASDAVNDHFGFSVSIFGDNIVIGAPFKTVKSYAQQGKVYFFSK